MFIGEDMTLRGVVEKLVIATLAEIILMYQCPPLDSVEAIMKP